MKSRRSPQRLFVRQMLLINYGAPNKYYSDIGRYLDNIRDEEQGMKPSGFAKDSKKQLLKILTKAVKTKKR